jgi:hypothetical protein
LTYREVDEKALDIFKFILAIILERKLEIKFFNNNIIQSGGQAARVRYSLAACQHLQVKNLLVSGQIRSP